MTIENRYPNRYNALIRVKTQQSSIVIERWSPMTGIVIGEGFRATRVLNFVKILGVIMFTPLLAACQSDRVSLMDARQTPDNYGRNTYFQAPELAASTELDALAPLKGALASRFAQETPASVYFALNSRQLDIGARDILREQARWMQRFPETTFEIYGYSDPSGPSMGNLSLAYKRADAVIGFLAGLGIERARLVARAESQDGSEPEGISFISQRRLRYAVTELRGVTAPNRASLASILQRPL